MEVDDVTTQYRFKPTAGGFVLCIHFSANKMVATDSYVWFFVYYSVYKHSLNHSQCSVITRWRSFILPTFLEDYYRKTLSNIVRENHVKCLEVFCTIFQTHKKLTLHIHHNKIFVELSLFEVIA